MNKPPQKNVKTLLIIIIISCSSVSNFYSQDLTNNLKIWSGISVSYKVNKNLNVKLSELIAYNASPSNYSFSQTKIALSYKLKRRIYISGGYVRGLFNDSNSLRRQGATDSWFNKLAVDRIYGNFSYKHTIVKRLSLKHKIEFQHFFTDLDKYKTRTIYAARVGYNVRKSSLSPYIEGQFFNYSGGIISSGIKRFRFKSGLSFKPITDSAMRVSLYYISQNEFKTEALPENDYAVFGLSLSFKIN
ncbi:DUF2490 domain-containing protein [Lutibacter sp.]|uniref:DUF2490 domain-containing protein n=1 Tax=Lutibacter sp. TaxID=1925666 RepID=UPI0025C41CD1|nr:DUF2490 domain-containing protein [Lutibacter sp.]MCF6168577.1 DUF2490 domain-containing protein [Lutibacter sp.]